MLFVIDLSTKMSGTSLFEKSLKQFFLDNTVWQQTKKLVLVVK